MKNESFVFIVFHHSFWLKKNGGAKKATKGE